MSKTGQMYLSEVERLNDTINELQGMLEFSVSVIKAHADGNEASMKPDSATQMAIREIEATLERLKP